MEELIIKAKNGDKDAYINLIQLIQKDLYNIAKVKLNNIEDVNDAIQNTILKSFENIKQLDEPKSFKSWIIKILINECNKMYIRNFKNIRLFNKIIQEETTNNQQDIENDMDFELLINKLDRNEKIIIVLYFNNKFSTSEIADILNINVNTVKTRLRRAKEKLRKLLEGGVNHE